MRAAGQNLHKASGSSGCRWLGFSQTSNRSKAAGQLMIAIVLIAIAAGSASALMFASIISGALRRGLLRMLGPREVSSTGEAEQWIDVVVTIAPAAAAIVAMMTLTLNLWLAAKITATSGRLHRPWPDLKSAALPPMTLVALCVAIAFCFTGGLLAILALIVTAALTVSYAVNVLS